MKCVCPNCNAVVDAEPINPDPEWMNDPHAEGKAYRAARNDDDVADWKFFRGKMDDVDDLFPEASVSKRKGYKREIYDLWQDFHDEKYGPGGRKCFAGSYADCVVASYDPENYPWRREMIPDQWWIANKPDWWD